MQPLKIKTNCLIVGPYNDLKLYFDVDNLQIPILHILYHLNILSFKSFAISLITEFS